MPTDLLRPVRGSRVTTMPPTSSFATLPHSSVVAVCKRCHLVMNDCEPFGPVPEFQHCSKRSDGTPRKCRNAGKYFIVEDGRDWEKDIKLLKR